MYCDYTCKNQYEVDSAKERCNEWLVWGGSSSSCSLLCCPTLLPPAALPMKEVTLCLGLKKEGRECILWAHTRKEQGGFQTARRVIFCRFYCKQSQLIECKMQWPLRIWSHLLEGKEGANLRWGGETYKHQYRPLPLVSFLKTFGGFHPFER